MESVSATGNRIVWTAVVRDRHGDQTASAAPTMTMPDGRDGWPHPLPVRLGRGTCRWTMPRAGAIGPRRRLVEQRHHVADVAQALLRILLETSFQQPSRLDRDLVEIRRRRAGCWPAFPATNRPDAVACRSAFRRTRSRRPRCRRVCPPLWLWPARAPCTRPCRARRRLLSGAR